MRPVQHYIYRAFSADLRLLYIGQTTKPEQRVRKHAVQSPWFSEAAEWEFQEVDGWYAMQDAERLAIQAERPLYNVQHNTNREIA